MNETTTLAPTQNIPATQSDTGTGFASRGFEIANMDAAWTFSERIANTAFAPKGLTKREDIFAAICYGVELGLPVMTALQSVAVVNGRPSIYGDTALGLVRASGKLQWITETFDGEGDDRAAVCTVKRTTDPEPVESRFSIADAKRAKIWGKQGPWTEYPQRMMKFRARGFALRDAFGDVLRGLYTAEEAADLPDERNITPPRSTKPDFTAGGKIEPTAAGAAPTPERKPKREIAPSPEELASNLKDWGQSEGHTTAEILTAARSMGVATGDHKKLADLPAKSLGLLLGDLELLNENINANKATA